LNVVFKRDESELDRTRHELLDLIAFVEAAWKAGERDEAVARLRAEFDRFPAIRNKFTAPMVFTAIARFATWAREKGRLDIAEAVLRAELQIAEEVLGDRHSHVRWYRVDLADLLFHLGQLDEAARLLRQVIPLAAMQDESAAHQLRLYARLIRAELQRDPKADVAELLEQMAALAPAAREDQYIWSWLHGAVMQEFVNADRDASELFLLCTAFLGEPARAAGEPVLAHSLRVGLAELLAGEGRFEEAEAQMLAVWEAVEADDQIAAGDRAGLARRIARIYHTWNKQEEAARWAKRAAGR
jgi:tetratricopeptide (TPR) repeat protein